MIAAVAALNRDLGKLAPDYVTDPAKAVYRVYRDTRFSSDKTPYKTHIAASLWNGRLGKNGGAGFYFHLSTKEFLIAGGLYHCPPEQLLLVRHHIAEHHQRLRSILRKKAIETLFNGLEGDQLARMPKGWPTDHPAADLLKYKDLLLEVTLPPEDAVKPDAIQEVGRRFRAMAPFIEFLNEPMLAAATAPRDPLRVKQMLGPS
jgi:uncharacterized protein (TIGR02453 family)